MAFGLNSRRLFTKRIAVACLLILLIYQSYLSRYQVTPLSLLSIHTNHRAFSKIRTVIVGGACRSNAVAYVQVRWRAHLPENETSEMIDLASRKLTNIQSEG